MRRGTFLAVSAILVLAGCSSPTRLKDMVGYVPPTSLPAQPKRTLVAASQELVWTQLVEFLESSAFEIDHIDPAEKLLVARYSGDPQPFIDCGSIVTHQNGALDQISGSARTVALNYELDEQPVILNRMLNLDSRIIIRLTGQPQGTVIETDTTYVVTKTVDIADASGAIREGNRETVSFEAGNRGEFSKGTACQPNGSLDLAVLQSLPNIVGTDDIDRAQLPDGGSNPFGAEGDSNEDRVAVRPDAESTETRSTSQRAIDDRTQDSGSEAGGLDAAIVPVPTLKESLDDWVLPEQGLPTAALPNPLSSPPDLKLPVGQRKTALPDSQDNETSHDLSSPGIDAGDESLSSPRPTEPSETAAFVPDTPPTGDLEAGDDSPTNIVDDTTRKLLQSLDCSGAEWHFCDLVELTTPYRKRNIEKLFGLTINTTESFTSQVIGRDLKLDVLFPTFPSHLYIAYARRDGLVEHVLTSPEAWPADLSQQLAETGQTIPGPSGLAMIVAIASDVPLFASPPEGLEDAAVYLDRLRQRLDELDARNPAASIAASQLLIYVENADT